MSRSILSHSKLHDHPDAANLAGDGPAMASIGSRIFHWSFSKSYQNSVHHSSHSSGERGDGGATYIAQRAIFAEAARYIYQVHRESALYRTP